MFRWFKRKKESTDQELREIPSLGTDYHGTHTESEVLTYLQNLEKDKVATYKLTIVESPIVHLAIRDRFVLTPSYIQVGNLGYMLKGEDVRVIMTEDYFIAEFPRGDYNGRYVVSTFTIVLKDSPYLRENEKFLR